MGVSVEKLLKLKAEDPDDLGVISACLQDALTCLGDMTYLPDEHRFAAMFSRYMWETEDVAPGAKGMRVRAGLNFDNVQSVGTQGIDQSDREGLLPLLAIASEADGESFVVTLQFAGGGTVKLQLDALVAHLRDMGEPWPTPSRPDHVAADALE